MSSERPDGSDPALPVLVHPAELPVRAFVRMLEAVQRVGRRLEVLLDRHGLSTAQFDVLANLRWGEGITQQELAERLLVTKGNVCGLLDRMSRAGLVERRPDPDDRRANRLYLTPGGRSLIDAVLPEHHDLVTRVVGGLGPDRLRTLLDLSEQVIAQARDGN